MAYSRSKLKVELTLKRKRPRDDETSTPNVSTRPALDSLESESDRKGDAAQPPLNRFNDHYLKWENLDNNADVNGNKRENEAGEDKGGYIIQESGGAPQAMKACGPACGKKCAEKIAQETRREIFDAYQRMSHSDRWSFVFHTVTQSSKKRPTTNGPSRRSKTFQYRLNNSVGEPQEVCKTFYLTTLGYHPKNDRVIVSVTGNASGVEPPKDRRGRHPPANKLDLSEIRQHVESFNPALSKREDGHDRRRLPSDVNIMMMYKDFKDKNDIACSYETYRKAIRNMNICFTKVGTEGSEPCLDPDIQVKVEEM